MSKTTSGFSLLELLVVIAILGTVGIFFFNMTKTNNFNKIKSGFEDTVLILKRYHYNAIADQKMYYVNIKNNPTLTIDIYHDSETIGRRSLCNKPSASNCGGNSQCGLLLNQDQPSFKKANASFCNVSGTCKLEGAVCFYSDGTSNVKNGLNNIQIYSVWDSKKNEGAAFKARIYESTSFVETFICKASSFTSGNKPPCPSKDNHWNEF